MAGLRLEGVSHAYGGKPAVAELSLSVEGGELLCLLGPSGCGKTTTLRIAAGLEPLQRGRVRIGGRLVAGDGLDLPPEQRRVGLVFQDYALFPHLSVQDNVAFGLRGGGKAGRAHELLERVHLLHLARGWPHTLSGGEQQRVALARALAPAPEVMLLDEPFSGLDTVLRDRVRDETLALLKDSGAATLLVTHDPEEAMRMADTIAVMREGRIVQQGAPDEIYNRPADTFVARFFGELNELSGSVDGGSVATPLGAFDAKLPPGTPVRVLIRPEALRISEEGTAAAVTAARSLGPFGLVRLRLEGGRTELVARVAAAALPAVGETVRFKPRASGVFVFPAAPGNAI